MCGIFGFYLSDPDAIADARVLGSMADALRHRGPDDEGLYIDGPLGLGMRRLSIIDLKTGRQPIANEDGSIQVVLNGEIYNYRELARQLASRGHRLRTSSDTEVIAHLYEDDGAECVHALRGMFAFAVWDRRAQTLFLGRDRLGIKPLYFTQTARGMVFASELKSLLRFPGVERRISLDALSAYLRYGYVPDPLSIFENVWKLAPGSSLMISEGRGDAPRRYWDPALFFAGTRRAVDEEAIVRELRGRLQDAVESHLVSDVPVGAFLSGGVDSSAVVALMTAAGRGRVKTFSIGFRETAFDERPYARAASRHFGTEHHELVVTPASLHVLDRIVEGFDEPFADASAIPTYFVSKLAREHVKVVLSGDGGDEVFAGYDRYLVDHRRRRFDVVSELGASAAIRWFSRRLPDGTPGKNYLFNMSLPRMERYLDAVSCFAPHQCLDFVTDDVREALEGRRDVVTPHVEQGRSFAFPGRLQHLDLNTYLPGDILTKLDRMTMAHSLEARVPLLDHPLVEFAAGLPSDVHLRDNVPKYIFKRALRGLIPETLLERRKRGFAVPLEHWFRDGLEGYIADHLRSGEIVANGWVRRDAVEALVQLYANTRRPECLQRLWVLFVFELWHRTYLAANGPSAGAAEGMGVIAGSRG